MIIKQILFIEMVSMSLLLSVFFAFATVEQNDAKQVSNNTEITAKSAEANQPSPHTSTRTVVSTQHRRKHSHRA
jgi:hypothetical protein